MSKYQQCQITNARLYYELEDGVVIGEDPVTCEPIFAPNTQFIELSIEPDETEAEIATIPGVDQGALRISGRLVNPRTFPAEVMPGGAYRLVYNFGGTIDDDAVLREGVLHLYQTIQSKFKRSRAKFGDFILGTLVATKNSYEGGTFT